MSNSDAIYVPVLRWKPAEKKALRDLRGSARRIVRPLIKPVPKSVKVRDPAGFARSFHQDLARHWGGREHFIDFSHLRGLLCDDYALALTEFARLASGPGIRPIPVVTRSVAMDLPLLTANLPLIEQFGMAIRVTSADLANNAFHTHLTQILRRSSISADRVDLVFDLQLVDESTDMSRTFAHLRELEAWRSITYLAGSFPRDLSELEKNGQHLIRRVEWESWRRIRDVVPVAHLGDHTVQHPLFTEPPPMANFSASIRYTSDDSWVVIRGEGVRNPTGPGYKQYPAQAELLQLRPEYKGPAFSAGDRYIEQLANQSVLTGSAQSWLRAGINHHMEFVAFQLQNHAAA